MTPTPDRFTQQARAALRLSQDEARRRGHNYLGTEHLLLGLVGLGEGSAARVLAEMGVTAQQVQSTVDFIITRGVPAGTSVSMVSLTPRAQRVLDLATEDADRLGHPEVGVEHLLLGLVHEGDNIATGVLASLGVGLAQLWDAVLDYLGVPPEARPAPPRTPRAAPPPGPGALWHSASFARATGTPPPAGQPASINRLSDAAQKALQFAHEEANRQGRTSIGSQDLLVGLAAEAQGPAAEVLAELGITLERARAAAAVEEPETQGLTSAAKQAIEQAVREVNRRGGSEVGTEHLLLGLLGSGDSAAIRVLVQLGTTPEAVRAALDRRLGSA